MNDLGRFIAKVVTLAFVTVVLTVGGCCVHIDYRIAKAIEQGSDPISARIAFATDSGYTERILYIANKEK